MGYFGRRPDALTEPQADAHEGQAPDMLDELAGDTVEVEQIEQPPPGGSRLNEFRDRITRALANFDRGRAAHPSLEPGEPGEQDERGEPYDQGSRRRDGEGSYQFEQASTNRPSRMRWSPR